MIRGRSRSGRLGGATRGGWPGRLRALGGILTAVALLLVGAGQSAAQAAPGDSAGGSQQGSQSVPLSPELEKIRAAEATELYGDPAERPMSERDTSLISLGDSQISGEGAGNYEPGTDGPDNWCHRSYDAMIHRTDIAADQTYNVACSGASSVNIRIGGEKQFADELVQSDSLAIKARNTKLKMVVLVAGANDDLQFGPVMSDCVVRWFTLQGACESKYGPGWQDRVDGLLPKVTGTVSDLRTVMRDAGYADDDYRMVVMSYPSPIGPDFEDNPDFRGKLLDGCAGYTSDAAWGRDQAVPAFQEGIRQAAQQSGVDYLDASRLFHGHEVCMQNTWARGLTVDLSNPFPPDANSVRQSFHPNARGHGAYASCLTSFHASELTEASCADPSGDAKPTLYAGGWDDAFAPLRNVATDTCLTMEEASSRNGTSVSGATCEGERHQGWWHDGQTEQVHTELTHDRCLDVPDSEFTDGAALAVWNCHGGANQQFTKEGSTLRPTAAGDLCVTLASASEPARLAACDGSSHQDFG